ncbi:hypothetical protein E4582_11185 [Luteimonas yindakuii]|uniref:Uncharacterized protein n=1 Tax=Luteimonas yindakuii TaxID=2565782 RepID=A0A4Z1RDN7_9GAMM|nr:hypothetical protein [Luteimonas yindakuii]TKS52797.1 hypothetical protein E4582_11185 [Luteimonas yindakuii]
MTSNPPLPTDNTARRSTLDVWLGAVAFALFVVWVLNLTSLSANNVELVVEARTTAGADGEVFYARAGEGYTPEQRVAFALVPDGQWRHYRVALPTRSGIDRIRIDPGSMAGEFALRRIGVETTGRRHYVEGAALADAKGVENQVQLTLTEAGDADGLAWNLSAPDPFVDFKLPDGAGVVSRADRLRHWLYPAVAAALAWLAVVGVGLPMLRRHARVRCRVTGLARRLADWCSDEGLLTVTPGMIGVVVALLAAALLYVALGLHQSSIGVWEELYPAEPVDQLVDLGTPKRIRSDEWNTQTPWVLSHVSNGFADHNIGVGGERAPLLATLPLAGPMALLQPKFYGFHLFDMETGFSWWWAYKTFGVLLSFFWLFLLLTQGRTGVSVLGAVWVYGSSFTQWWLSSHLPEQLIGFACACIGALYLLFGRRRRWIVIGAGLFGWAALNLMMHPYPPFIVPLAYLGVAILVGVACERGHMGSLRASLGSRAMAAAGLGLVTVGLGALFLVQALPTIEILSATSYPGRRISSSGEFPLLRQFYGYFEGLRLGELPLPLPPTNASEASSFIILAPLVLLAVPFRSFLGRQGVLLTALVVYCVLVGLWIGTPIPGPLEWLMQNIGWAWVPGGRAVVGFGIGSIIASIVLLARVGDGDLEVRPVAARWMIVLLVASSLLLFGGWLRALDPTFFTDKVLIAGTLAVTSMAAGIVLGRPGALAFGLGIALMAPLMVNPLVSGLSAIRDKPVLVAAERQGGAAGDRWAVVGDMVFSQGLKAHGLEVITGSKMVPNHALLRVLDPEGRFLPVWNRYAHVVFTSAPDKSGPEFTLISPDLYEISLDVCGPAMDKLAVTRLAYTSEVPDQDLNCLRELPSPTDSGVRLFARVRADVP